MDSSQFIQILWTRHLCQFRQIYIKICVHSSYYLATMGAIFEVDCCHPSSESRVPVKVPLSQQRCSFINQDVTSSRTNLQWTSLPVGHQLSYCITLPHQLVAKRNGIEAVTLRELGSTYIKLRAHGLNNVNEPELTLMMTDVDKV